MKKLKRLHKRYMETLAAKGVKDPDDEESLKSLTNEFMELKLAPKVFDALVGQLRDVDQPSARPGTPRHGARVRDAGMPRKDFIASFPKNETNLSWVDKHIRQKRKHSSALHKAKEEIQKAQKRCRRSKS